MLNNKQKIARMMVWYRHLDEKQKEQVLKNIFDIALDAEEIDILDEQQADKCAEYFMEPIEKYFSPFFVVNGKKLDEPRENTGVNNDSQNQL